MTAAVAVDTIDAQTAYDLLAAAVELAGRDHLYESESGDGCSYTHGDQPGCIVGVALAIHGVPLDVMADWYSTIDYVAEWDGGADFLTPDAVDVFVAAQRVQDRSMLAPLDATATWGKALDAAAETLAAIA